MEHFQYHGSSYTILTDPTSQQLPANLLCFLRLRPVPEVNEDSPKWLPILTRLLDEIHSLDTRLTKHLLHRVLDLLPRNPRKDSRNADAWLRLRQLSHCIAHLDLSSWLTPLPLRDNPFQFFFSYDPYFPKKNFIQNHSNPPQLYSPNNTHLLITSLDDQLLSCSNHCVLTLKAPSTSSHDLGLTLTCRDCIHLDHVSELNHLTQFLV